MKNIFNLILIALSGAIAPLNPPMSEVGTQLVKCDNLAPLLKNLASYATKAKCPPCSVLAEPLASLQNHIWKPKDDPNTETRRECFDGKDNDDDGKTDCEDPDCLKDKRIQQRCMMMERRRPHTKPLDDDMIHGIRV